jgi:ATP/maltotriose-dependent transcriptional regulator MalT
MVSLLARPRVDARLDEAFDAPLMLVCAPAGYGKTVAVASWVRSRGLAAAWTSLDEGAISAPYARSTTPSARFRQTSAWSRCRASM